MSLSVLSNLPFLPLQLHPEDKTKIQRKKKQITKTEGGGGGEGEGQGGIILSGNCSVDFRDTL